jgi:hypothetical protein
MSSRSRRPLSPLPPPRCALARRAQARAWWRLGAAGAALALAACGESPRAADPQTAPSAESAEVSIRFDVSAGKPTSVQVLAFHSTTSAATTSATGASSPTDWRPDVLGVVDPLAATSPEQGCALRDLDLAATTLALRGGSIELRELGGVSVGVAGLPGAETLVRPFPRLFPDVATVVGGVVADSGPQPVAALPEHVTLFTAESELPATELVVPTAPRLVAINGVPVDVVAPPSTTTTTTALAGSATPAAATLRADTQNGLALTLVGGAGGRVEVRPFGATMAVACAIPANAPPEAVVTIPRAFLLPLARAMGTAAGAPFAASLEIARRTHLRQALGGTDTRVSVEVRTAATVELRP